MSSDQEKQWQEARDKARRYFEKEKEITDARAARESFSRIRELEAERQQILNEGRLPAIKGRAQEKADLLNVIDYKIIEHRMAIRELEEERAKILSER